MINSKYTLKWVLIILLLIVILYIYFNKSEYFITPIQAITKIASAYANIHGTATFNNIKGGSIRIGKRTIKSDSYGNFIITDISKNIILQSNSDKSITTTLNNSNILNGSMTNTVGINMLLKGGLLADVSGRYVLYVYPSPWTSPNTTPIHIDKTPVTDGTHPVNTTGGALGMYDTKPDITEGLATGEWVSTTTNIPNGVYGSGGDSYMVVEPCMVPGTAGKYFMQKSGISLYYPGSSEADPPFKVGAIKPT